MKKKKIPVSEIVKLETKIDKLTYEKRAKIESIAILSQIKLFSSKRLLRRIEKISPNLFNNIKRQLRVVTEGL